MTNHRHRRRIKSFTELEEMLLPTPITFEGSVNFRDQRVTPIPIFSDSEQGDQSVEKFSMEFQMTIRSRVERLTRKQASMLLMVQICEIVTIGIDLPGYLTVEFLYSFLLGSKTSTELKEERERRTAMLAEFLLTYTRGEWMTLKEREELSQTVIQKIHSTGWLPSRDTLRSWITVYKPNLFLEVRVVRLSDLMEHPTNTEPYSGYTKGYGNGGHTVARKKTRYDSETDGETTDLPPVGFPLWEYEKYLDILLAIESEKARKRRTRK